MEGQAFVRQHVRCKVECLRQGAGDLSTHGKKEVAWVLGSVAEKVVSHATVPVLFLRVMEVKLPLLGLREQAG
jgi:hypothetical protein